MTDETILTATEASRSFSELLHRVCYGGESFIIKKGQRLMARVTPMETAPQIFAVPASEVAKLESEDTPPENMSADEAEFYRAWMEQVRKVEA